MSEVERLLREFIKPHVQVNDGPLFDHDLPNVAAQIEAAVREERDRELIAALDECDYEWTTSTVMWSVMEGLGYLPGGEGGWKKT